MRLKDKIKHIREHPEAHNHTFDELMACCLSSKGIELVIMDAHEEYAPVGRNGDRNCDVSEGPCSCGAFH